MSKKHCVIPKRALVQLLHGQMNLDLPIQDLFHKNVHVMKKKEILNRKVFKLQRFSKVFPNVGGNALFWRGH